MGLHGSFSAPYKADSVPAHSGNTNEGQLCYQFILKGKGGKQAVKGEVKVDMEGLVKGPVGKDVQIPCLYTTDEGIGSLMIEWFYLKPTGQQIRIYYHDATVLRMELGTQFTDRIQVAREGSKGAGHAHLNINKTQPRDEVDFICKVKSLTGSSAEGRTQLRIGSCEVKNGYPRPNITWYKDNQPLVNIPNEVSVVPEVTTESSQLFSVKSELSLKVVKEDKDSEFYCEVNYMTIDGHGMMESDRIKIMVHYPADKVSVWVESPKGDIKEGDTVELQCHSNGNPQPTFSFKHETTELESTNNVLVLRNVSRLNSGLYECSTFNLEDFVEVVGNATLFVHYLDAAVVSPNSHSLFKGGELNASCNALSSLDTDIYWMKDKMMMATGNILSLTDVEYDTAGTYECIATVPQMVNMTSSAALQLIVTGPPEMQKPQTTSIEETLNSMVDLTCTARGFPIPTVTWTPSQVVLVSSTKKEDWVVSMARVKVTSDMDVNCTASNDHGRAEVLFSIKAKSRGVIIAVVIICLLLLAVLGSVLYFLYKKGKICGRSGKQDLTKEKTSKDNIVVEMKSDSTEDAVLLAVNGDKKPPGEQVERRHTHTHTYPPGPHT
ncbi:Cell surface glycoprotein MUC18 [Merluccius polli]|uniref:Cell surface glycoprotein MUC18 n=1 Tax=Merluccius polli TaxID=89951 RepID=A0AA47P427_MERPO|nr:Cell surface glycoprotein MUC18 [Merluccius polli]